MSTLQSFIAGQWLGNTPAQALASAIDGSVVAHTHAEALDFAQALDYARTVGLPALLKTNFQQRAAMLKALGKYLVEHKESLYELSCHTGATRTDSWIDIEGGAGTLFAYASMAKGLPQSGNLWAEDEFMPLGKTGIFGGQHILAPRRGVAVHIDAFNFPIWGLLEKFAPTFLAGMPSIGKPATATSYLTEKAMRLIDASGILPPGALQLVIGSTGDLLDRLQMQDVVTFTGSAQTAARLRVTPNLVANSIAFNAEADSLNCAILAPDVTPDMPEFDLYVKEIAREMTQKAGQKCTAIRRALVPAPLVDAVAAKLKERLAKVTVGDPRLEQVRMGALASKDQQADVAAKVQTLRADAELVFGGGEGFAPLGEQADKGAYFQPTLLLAKNPATSAANSVEAFGPVSTLMPYQDLDEALALAALGQGSLAGTLVTQSADTAAQAAAALAACHGRLQILDSTGAPESTGHGAALPYLKHGGPGRAGGGEELGGLRAVKHMMQRTALQGSPAMLAAITTPPAA